MLVRLVHGGLRFRKAYMACHRRTLEAHIAARNHGAYATYVACLPDTFGSDYVTHLGRWLAAVRDIPAARPAETRARERLVRVVVVVVVMILAVDMLDAIDVHVGMPVSVVVAMSVATRRLRENRARAIAFGFEPFEHPADGSEHRELSSNIAR